MPSFYSAVWGNMDKNSYQTSTLQIRLQPWSFLGGEVDKMRCLRSVSGKLPWAGAIFTSKVDVSALVCQFFFSQALPCMSAHIDPSAFFGRLQRGTFLQHMVGGQITQALLRLGLQIGMWSPVEWTIFYVRRAGSSHLSLLYAAHRSRLDQVWSTPLLTWLADSAVWKALGMVE